MAKAAKEKKKPKDESDNVPDMPDMPEIPDHDSDNVVVGAFDSADDNDPYYNRESPDSADADIDYSPNEDHEAGDDGREGHDGDEGDGDSLTPEQLRNLRESAEKMRRPLSFMKIDDHGKYLINEMDVSGQKALAFPDKIVIQRSLWIVIDGKSKSVESHGYFLIELNGKPVPRPNTFTNRARWKEYHRDHKQSDPWGNFQTFLGLQSPSGGIIALQASTAAVKAAIGDLLAAFVADGGKRRPIIEFASDVNPETGESFPVLRIIGWTERNGNFNFLRDMLIKDDPEYPEPEEKPDDFSAHINS
jgi:hypothetical protein